LGGPVFEEGFLRRLVVLGWILDVDDDDDDDDD